jgi:hypothetical protein
MKILALIFLLNISYFFAHANDGVFYAQGNHLVPVKETTIQLKKEVLKLKRMDDYMAVEVNFEFYNPGPSKTETVGFVTPPADGDVDEETAGHPQISNFSAVVNGIALQFQIARLEASGFQLSDSLAFGNDFVYYFPVTFKPGLNLIKHKYLFRGGSSVEMAYDFDYRLTTGNMWANGEIGDFTLEIDMGPRALYTLPWSFWNDGHAAPWKIVGKGKYAAEKATFLEMDLLPAYVNSGVMQLKQLHFHPERDLAIIGWQIHNQGYVWGRNDLASQISEWLSCVLYASSGSADCVESATDEQLRLMRNFLYARHGLAFQSQDLQLFFGQFIWYDPIIGLQANSIKLEEWEKGALKAVMAEEARRKE